MGPRLMANIVTAPMSRHSARHLSRDKIRKEAYSYAKANEGQPPKERVKLHTISELPKEPFDREEVKALCVEYYQRHGTKPVTLHIPGRKRLNSFVGLETEIGGVSLDIVYGSEDISVG